MTDSTLQACWELPADTFGGAYARFMGVRHFVPRDRPPVRFVDDEELAYVAARCVAVLSRLRYRRLSFRRVHAGRGRCMICGMCCLAAAQRCPASWL